MLNEEESLPATYGCKWLSLLPSFSLCNFREKIREFNLQEIKFGVQLRNFPSHFDGEICSRIIALALRCEKLGYDSVWMVDHLEMRPPIAYEAQPIPECWSMISAMASATSRINVGSLVSCCLFRNPAYLARICDTLAELSNNRLVVGLGSGWFQEEFDSYGLEFPATKERMHSLRRTIQTIQKIHGSNVQYPIWIGGSGENVTLRLVAKYAAGCSLFGGPQIVERKLNVLRGHCAELKRNYEAITKSKQSNVVIANTKAEVEEKLRKIIPDESKWEDFLASNIVGTPDDCIKQVQRYSRAGANYLTLNFPDLFESNCLDIFSNEVIRELN